MRDEYAIYCLHQAPGGRGVRDPALGHVHGRHIGQSPVPVIRTEYRIVYRPRDLTRGYPSAYCAACRTFTEHAPRWVCALGEEAA